MQAFFLTHSQFGLRHASVMAKNPDNSFGARLQMLINESSLADMTQAEIAKRFDVSPPMVTHYKDGAKLPAMKTAIRMAHQLECCVEFLLTGRGPRHPGESPSNGDKIVFDMAGIPPDQKGRFEKALHAVAQSVREMMVDYRVDQSQK